MIFLCFLRWHIGSIGVNQFVIEIRFQPRKIKPIVTLQLSNNRRLTSVTICRVVVMGLQGFVNILPKALLFVVRNSIVHNRYAHAFAGIFRPNGVRHCAILAPFNCICCPNPPQILNALC